MDDSVHALQRLGKLVMYDIRDFEDFNSGVPAIQ